MAERRTAGKEAAEPDFLQFNDLVCETVGGKVIFATDEWFAPAKNLLKREPPQFIASAFTEFGKWMDGWETRRKRTPGHDWCIIQLGVPGLIYGLDVDTSFFTGNHSPYVSIQASCLDQVPPFTPEGDRTGMAASDGQMAAVAKLGSEAWPELVSVSELQPGYSDCCHNYFIVSFNRRVTHLRLNMYPGLGRAANMADGWETARRLDRPRKLQADQRGILQVPGWEWAVFRLGHPGLISSVEVDTNHFKGNFPDSCRIEACTLTPEQEAQCIRNRWNSGKWQVLLPPQKLQPHHRHHYGKAELKLSHPVTHIRLIIAPDGGVSRLRLWGRPTPITAALANQRSPASKL
ncbi:allantoicase isoform X2 [Archocentrus centrarchus]|uniref:allantoicase isoform X2 n=1 Tax=Archocentrus centrarchus TaxID=63155 RepID=UPI0011EA2815|nr:probable allantoicase isoform X2 [Archocentrus centrarchus]